MAETVTPEAVREATKDEEIIEVPRTSEKLPGTKVDFYYVPHALELSEDIARKAGDADLVLVEAVGATQEKRTIVEKVLNRVTATNFNEDPAKAEILKELSTGKDFAGRIAAALAGTGKTIWLIDVSVEHPAIDLFERAKLLKKEILELAKNGDLEEALQAYPNYLRTFAESDRLREDFVLEQISSLVPTFGGAKQVAVFQGAAHTGVHHRFAKVFPDIDASIEYPGRSLFQFPPFDALVRQQLFFPEKELGQEEVRRAFVGEIILAQGARILASDPGEFNLFKFCGQLSRQVTLQEAKDIFDQFTTDYFSVLEDQPDRSDRAKVATFLTVAATLTSEWAEKKGVTIPE